MMIRPLLLVLLICICCSATSTAAVKGKVVAYGIVDLSGPHKKLAAPESAARVSRLYDEVPVLKTVTDRIPARLGVRFGIYYEITDIPGNESVVEIVHVRKSPLTRRPDGTTSRGSERVMRLRVAKDRSAASFFGFGFDHDYELVQGNWVLEVKLKGRSLCKKSFQVVGR